MRHRVKTKKIGRNKAHRKAMLANMASSLIINEYVVTTVQKGKLCKSFVDKVITIGKKGDLTSKRRLYSLLRDKNATAKVIEVYAKRYENRIGGFVTIKRLGNRKGDNAELAKLIMIGSDPFRKVKKVRVKKKKSAEKKKDKEEKEKEGEAKKRQSVFDRVKSLRGKLAGSKEGRPQEKGRGRIAGKVERKSRSGI